MTIVASSRSHRLWSQWIWIFAAVLIGLLLIPYVLTPLYLIVRPVSTLMLWRWATGVRVDRVWVPIEQIGRAVPRAVIAAEDARFCQHYGVDFREIREAIEESDDLFEARGGSTIAQQTAKNLFLWPGRSFVRKALELPLALWLDLVLGKRRLLEIYLNIAEWGPDGQFGAEAGARHAFGRSARDLSTREAALMAAVLPAPRRRDARRPGPQLRRLAAIYERRAVGSAALDRCVRGGRAP
jgi:monofunctional biosynthetic peptidoglycan transglycosylase